MAAAAGETTGLEATWLVVPSGLVTQRWPIVIP